MSEEQEHSGLFDEDFLDGAVGTNEIELRRQMGHEHFEAYMQWVANNRQSSLDLENAHSRRLNAVASNYETFNALQPLIFLSAVITGAAAMVMWAVH